MILKAVLCFWRKYDDETVDGHDLTELSTNEATRDDLMAKFG